MPTFLISQTFLPPRRRDCHATISSPHHQKLLSWRKCGGVCQNAVVGVGASLHRLCATAIVHPCTSCLLCWFRITASSAVWVATSVHRQPFVPLHLCNDSHLCRCIVQRLCVAVFMLPCIPTLFDHLYASLHRAFWDTRPASVPRLNVGLPPSPRLGQRPKPIF